MAMTTMGTLHKRELCTLARCGDGESYRDEEACDDGNLQDRDGCTSQCELAACGDALLRMDLEVEDLFGRV